MHFLPMYLNGRFLKDIKMELKEYSLYSTKRIAEVSLRAHIQLDASNLVTIYLGIQS